MRQSTLLWAVLGIAVVIGLFVVNRAGHWVSGNDNYKLDADEPRFAVKYSSAYVFLYGHRLSFQFGAGVREWGENSSFKITS